MKTCKRCAKRKPLEEFPKNSSSKDGRRGYCDPCNRMRRREWREKNPEKVREHIERAKAKESPERRKERARINGKRYYETHREQSVAYTREWRRQKPELRRAAERRARLRSPEKIRARDALAKAVFRGKIAKPKTCERCTQRVESPHDLHGHHEDYSKPLEVEWLCRDCHATQHRREDAVHV